jgi:hypothetical protein
MPRPEPVGEKLQFDARDPEFAETVQNPPNRAAFSSR